MIFRKNILNKTAPSIKGVAKSILNLRIIRVIYPTTTPQALKQAATFKMSKSIQGSTD